MYDGTLCTKGPWEALVTFQQFLVLADPEGQVDMTAEAISRRTTIPIEIIEKGIVALLKPDPKSRTPTEDGRRLIPLSEGRDWGWLVVNYKHYRDMKREEERREYHRAYWHKRKEKLNNSAKLNEENTDSTHSTDSTKSTEKVDSRQDTETETGKSTASPPDGGKTVFDLAIASLGDQGIQEKTARQFVGSLFRDWDTTVVDAAFRAAIGKQEIKAYVMAVLKERPKKHEGKKVAI